MFKWEKRIVEWADKHLYLFAWILITIVGLLIRRGGMWHTSFDLEKQFYTDAVGYYHTPFYTALIYWISHIPLTPVRTVKIIISGFDFCTAVAVLIWLNRKNPGYKKSLTLLTCYAVLLISPLVIANGLVWLHMDSICVLLLLCAVLIGGKYRQWIGWSLVGLASAISSQYLVVYLAAAFILIRKKKTSVPHVLAGVGVFFGLNVLGAAMAAVDWKQGFCQMFGWIWFHPETGILFDNLFVWLLTMLGYYSYILGVGTLTAALLYKKGIWMAVTLHGLLAIYIGQILQFGYFL